MAKKYKVLVPKLVKFTGVTIGDKEVEHKMYRIKALRDIPAHNVKAGDLGGWVNRRKILSHEGDCWIGGEAKVFSEDSYGASISGNALVTDEAIVYCQGTSGIRIFENAIVNDNVKIFLYTRERIARIHGNARLSGKVIAHNPIEITGTISEEASIAEGSSVMGNAHVSGSAKISNSAVLGAARVLGQAKVSKVSTISENAVITDQAEVSASEIRGTATISGSAKVEDGAVVCDSAKVTDNAVVKKNAIIAGESVVKDNAAVLESTRILGESIISGTMVTISYKDYTDYISSENRSLSAAPIQKELTGTAPSLEAEASDIQALRLKLEGLEKEINAYGNDIVKLLKFPIMTDLRDENTLEMVLALKNAKIINPVNNPQGFRESVESLERKFLKAESNARIIRATAFSEEQRKKAEKARDLFAVACNDVSSEQEKKSAFKQGFRQLEGVVDFTDSAVENMRVKVGIPELEA